MLEREVDMSGPSAPIETVEDEDLIASDKVEGTNVYGSDHRKVGHVHNFMVNKRTGQVAHVVVSDGGLFGLGASRYVRLAWRDLAYAPELGGYVAPITKAMVEEYGRASADDAEMQIW